MYCDIYMRYEVKCRSDTYFKTLHDMYVLDAVLSCAKIIMMK